MLCMVLLAWSLIVLVCPWVVLVVLSDSLFRSDPLFGSLCIDLIMLMFFGFYYKEEFPHHFHVDLV